VNGLIEWLGGGSGEVPVERTLAGALACVLPSSAWRIAMRG
jgi:hypothetical protein